MGISRFIDLTCYDSTRHMFLLCPSITSLLMQAICKYVLPLVQKCCYPGEWHHELQCGRHKQQNPVRRDLDDKKSSNKGGSRIG